MKDVKKYGNKVEVNGLPYTFVRSRLSILGKENICPIS